MNGIKSDVNKEASQDLDDLDNLPPNLARYARSSYSRKEIEEEAAALLMEKNESTHNTLTSEVSSLPEMFESVKDDKLVKKLKEALLIKKMRNEMEIPKINPAPGPSEEITNDTKLDDNINQRNLGSGPIVLSNDYNNGIEEPEDEVVSYKTETDQESLRTDSRASEVSSVNSVNHANISIVNKSSIANGVDKVADTVNCVIGDSVIVRDHDESSSSGYEEDIEVKINTGTKPGKSVLGHNKLRGNGNSNFGKTNKDISNNSGSSKIDRRMGRRRSSTKGNKNGNPSAEIVVDELQKSPQRVQSDQRVDLSMSPTVIIKELNLKK